jgi:hypothetical protein
MCRLIATPAVPACFEEFSMSAPAEKSGHAAPASASFVWEDPFLLEAQLTEDERMSSTGWWHARSSGSIRATARR